MLSFAHIIPAGICDSIPEDLPFLFFHQRDEQYGLLDRIARHIENLDSTIIEKLELSLNLQFTRTTRDSHGNVCFAGDPNLRPEYRTIFHAIHLWDFYYALWHSGGWWDRRALQKEDLLLPDPDLFWGLVSQGKKLRRIHVSKIPKTWEHFSPSFSDEVRVYVISNRFRRPDKSAPFGRLYLNNDDYISQIPARAWEFHLGHRRFLSDYLSQRTGQKLGRDQITELLQWIVAIDRSQRVVEGAEEVIS